MEKKGEQLELNVESFKTFKWLYNDCKAKKLKTFMFQGKEIVVAYAKYVIQYLEQTKFKNLKNHKL